MTGSACHPGCSHFSPTKYCDHSTLDLTYQTFAQVFWSFRRERLNEYINWKTFYRCFHDAPDGHKKKQFKVEFPHDVPVLSNMAAQSNYEVGKHVPPGEPSHWSEERLRAATRGTDIEKRMASVDWDWAWYEWATRDKGLRVDMTIAKNKVAFDKIMVNMFGDDYEDDSHHEIPVDHPQFIKLKTHYVLIKDYIKNKIEFVSGQKEGGTRNRES